MENHELNKGVKTKLFGVILIFLSILDSMLAWRGGVAVNDFYLFLFVSGVLLYLVGTIRQGQSGNE